MVKIEIRTRGGRRRPARKTVVLGLLNMNGHRKTEQRAREAGHTVRLASNSVQVGRPGGEAEWRHVLPRTSLWRDLSDEAERS